MTTLARDTGALSRKAIGLLPWAGAATIALYAMGYVDGGAHAAIFAGDGGPVLSYLHEFFHHARHVGLMCH